MKCHPLLLFPFLVGPIALVGQIGPLRPFKQMHAVVVGVSDYQHPEIPDLSYAHRDAQAVADFLSKDALWKVSPENLTLLVNDQATEGAFLQALKDRGDACQRGDRLVLYFAGHGDIEQTPEQDMGYLLLHDAHKTTYSAGGTCSLETLNDYLQSLILDKAVEVIFVSDACRSGSLAGQDIGGARITTAAIAQLFQQSIKILSCEAQEISVEADQWGDGRGLFSYYFVKGLKGEADRDQNRYVELIELERYVQDSVRAASGNRQNPFAQGGSKTTQLNKVPQGEPQLTAQKNRFTTQLAADTSYLPVLEAFSEALDQGNLLYPEGRSAYAYYQSLANDPAARSTARLMKFRLSAALQDEAQKAINDYIRTPAKVLAERWTDESIYQYYPEYLAKASELIGSSNSFSDLIQSKEHYFRGVNARLKAKGPKTDPTWLQTALAEQEKALALQPNAPHIHNELGLIYRAMNQPDLELQAFQTACALSPKWGLALTNLAYTYKRQDRFAEAEMLYQEAIITDPTLPLSYYNLAILYQDNNNVGLAIDLYQKTLQLDSAFADAYRNLAWIYSDQPGREWDALALIERYNKINPDRSEGFELAGYVYNKMGEPEEALDAFLQAYQQDSTSLYALEKIADIQQYLGQYESSISFWKKCLSLHQDDAFFYLELARTYVLNQQFELAIQTVSRLLETGYQDEKMLRNDPDLNQIPLSFEYQDLLDQYFNK